MSQPTPNHPEAELQDLEQPQRELTPDETAQVEGGFNPQPDPPGFVMDTNPQASKLLLPAVQVSPLRGQ